MTGRMLLSHLLSRSGFAGLLGPLGGWRQRRQGARNAPITAALVGVATALLMAGCSVDTPQDLISSGQSYLAKRDARSAIVQFKAALQQEPNNPQARYLLGRALLDAGDPGSAIVELGKAQDLRYSDTQVVPMLARALLLAGQYRRVTDTYDNVHLDDRAALADLKTTLAAAWGAQGDRERTERAVALALELVPTHGPAHILQARILGGQRRYDEALALVQQALAKDDKLYEGWHLLGELQWYARQDEKAAVEAFRRTLALERAYLPAHAALVAIALSKGDVDAMKAQAQQMAAVLPGHPQVRYTEAQIAFAQRDYVRAREIVQELLRVAPDHVGTLQMAAAIETHIGSLLLAENHLTKAVRLAPNFVPARVLLGQTYLRLGQPQRALQVLQPALVGEVASADAISVAASAFLQLTEPARAEELFRRAAELAPDNARIRTALALSQLSRGETGAAFAQLESVAASNSDTFADMALISARLARREYDQALQAIEVLARKQPDTAVLASLRARIHEGRGQPAEARQQLERALSIDPMYYPAAARLTQYDVADGQPLRAVPRFEAMVRTDPQHAPARLAIADLHLRAGRPHDEVVAMIAEAIKVAPSEVAPRLALIDLQLRDKNFTAALAAAQQGIAALPDSPELLEMLGRAQLAAGDHQQALNSFRRLAGGNPGSAQAQMRLAETHLAMRDRRAAETAYRRALEIQPNLPDAQRGLMDLVLQDRRPRDALQVARLIQTQRPDEATGWLFEATIQNRLGNTAAAITAYRGGLRRRPHPELAAGLHRALITAGQRAEANRLAADWERQQPGSAVMDLHLSDIAIEDRDLPQAEQRLRRALQREPGNAGALNNLAWVLVQQGQAGAVELAERANRLLPNRVEVLDTLALALAAEGQHARALELQKTTLERAPEDFGLRLNLARIALQAGDKALARSELEKVARFASAEQKAEANRLLQTL